MFFSCCDIVASPQETAWAPAWAPRSRTYTDVDNGPSTPEATPRFYAAGAVGAITAKTCVCAAKLRPSLQVLGGRSPRTQLVCSFAECSSPAATASHRRRQRSRQRPGRHDPERAIMLITGRRRRRPRRGFVPQVQAAQQRLQYASAPPSYGQVSSSSNVHRREGHLASVQMMLVIFTLFFGSFAECSSPDSAASRRRRQRPGQWPGHQDQARSTHSERRRGQRPRHHDQVPATHKERRRGQRSRHHDQEPVINNCRGRPAGHHDQVPA